MPTLPIDFASDRFVLPPPQLPEGVSLRDALWRRHSTRAFGPEPLSASTLSALLWSAFGINRPGDGGRTAPSAHNWQEIDVYAVLAEGCFRCDAQAHQLLLAKAEDLRGSTGTQDFVAGAALNLVYVADFARMVEAGPRDREFLAGADAGCIAQNVYLYCACAGLATVVRGLIDRRRLAAALGLSTTQRVALAQTVGQALHL